MPQFKYSELDFKKVKENLKTFLRSQDKFKDYDFDGSGLSILLDLLAYNTSYNGFYLNMVANEMFLDTAILRDSIVSRAKHLGYTPRSIRSCKAIVDLSIDPSLGPGPMEPASIFIPRNTLFYTSIDGSDFYFTPTRSVMIENIDGKYEAKNVELIEGRPFTHKWTYNAGTSFPQRFIIPNDNVDTSVLSVKVQESATSSVQQTFVQHQDFTEVKGDDLIYFLQGTSDNRYEIVFGDGVVGKALEDGNIVIVDYIVSSGEDALGARRFFPVDRLGGYIRSTITTVTPARDFAPIETNESIKKLAPLSYDAQNRAVTRQDYETLIKKDVPAIEYLRVWGGEDNDPPHYGKVFVAVKPFTGLSLSADQKEILVNNYIRPRNPISIEVVIVEPDYLRLNIESLVFFDSTKTLLSAPDLIQKVKQSILDFKASDLRGFESHFRYSRLVRAIDDSDPLISGNLTNINLHYRIFPPFNVPTRFEIKLKNEISRGDALNQQSAINSTPFIYKGINTYLSDNGRGVLHFYRIVDEQRVVVQDDVGRVDYSTGTITLHNLTIQNIPNELDYIDLIVKPEQQNIYSHHNQIIILEEENIFVATRDTSIN